MFTLNVVVDVDTFEDAVRLQNDIVGLCKASNLVPSSGIYKVKKYHDTEVVASNNLVTIGPPNESDDV